MNAHKDLLSRNAKHSRQAANRDDERPHVTQPDYTNVPSTPDELQACAIWFQKFLHRDDGYLKVKREPDSSQVHFTWTWTLGKWSRHYVYTRAEYYLAKYALEILERKLMDVEEGIRIPTPDHFRK